VLIFISIMNILLNVILNNLFSMAIGVSGIALSTSVVYFFTFLCLYFYLSIL
jgi:putative peptidoglycan lipid II flippase